MSASMWGHGIALAALAGALAIAPPTVEDLREAAAMAVRPAVLPFAWQGLLEAEQHGEPAEAFARAQYLMQLLPQWADGFAAFAYGYVLAEDAASAADAAHRSERRHARLQLAMAWMDAARAAAGRHEPSLLLALAFLPDFAVQQDPELAPRLPPGGAAGLADRYLAELEQRFPSAAARDQRTFFAPRLAAALLGAGNRDAAVAVLRQAIVRSGDARDQALATAWRTRLEEVVRWLLGDRTIDLAAVRADSRMAPLLPHLR